MGASARLAYVNDYGVDDATLESCRGLRYPRHHLWGMQRILLERDEPVLRIHNHPASKSKNPRIAALELKLSRLAGHLRILWGCRGARAVYAPQSGHTTLLAALRGLGLSRKRLLAVVHHPDQHVGSAASYDRLLFVSSEVMRAFLERPANRGIDNAEHVFWGPDLDFYRHHAALHPDPPSTPVRFISNGKSWRDNRLFLDAAGDAGACATVVCDGSFRPSPGQLSDPRFRIVTHSASGNVISDAENIRLLRESHVMVLPVLPGHAALCGLTSFLDAIALGMPIIQSHNTMIGVDVEAEGFGFVVPAGDRAALAAAMLRFQEAPELASEMGARARAFGEKHHAGVFAERIEAWVAEATGVR